MAKCIVCGKDSQSWICDECAVNDEQLCSLIVELLNYKPGVGDNALWDQIALDFEGQVDFREIALVLSEKIASPLREYYRAICLAGGRDYLPKNEREWICHLMSKTDILESLSVSERDLLKGFALSAYFSDYAYEEAENLAKELSTREMLPRKTYCILGDFYTKTRRYEKAQSLLNQAMVVFEANEEDKKAITKALLDTLNRKNRAEEGKSEYMPNPKENTQEIRKKYVAFLEKMGIEINTEALATRRAIPKPIVSDMYPDVEEIRRADFNSFVAFDLKTTGLSPKMDCIVQIGAIKVINGQIVDSEEYIFDELVKPYKKTISEKITELTGISNEDVKCAREMWEVFPDFIKFCDGLNLVGYNSVDFDSKFLIRAGRYSNLIMENKVFDVMHYVNLFKEQLGGNKSQN